MRLGDSKKRPNLSRLKEKEKKNFSQTTAIIHSRLRKKNSNNKQTSWLINKMIGYLGQQAIFSHYLWHPPTKVKWPLIIITNKPKREEFLKNPNELLN
jgi:hypothetical protein